MRHYKRSIQACLHHRKNVNINSMRNKFSNCNEFAFNETDISLLFQKDENKHSRDLTLHVNESILGK